jgi:hypothetical protein
MPRIPTVEEEAGWALQSKAMFQEEVLQNMIREHKMNTLKSRFQADLTKVLRPNIIRRVIRLLKRG